MRLRSPAPKRGAAACVWTCRGLDFALCARAYRASMNFSHDDERPDLSANDLVSRTFLDYVNGILMDESVENYSNIQIPSPHTSRAYQLIFSGFRDILTDQVTDTCSPLTAGFRQFDYSCSERGRAADELRAENRCLPLSNEHNQMHGDVDTLYLTHFDQRRQADKANTAPIGSRDQHRLIFCGQNDALDRNGAANLQFQSPQITNRSSARKSYGGEADVAVSELHVDGPLSQLSAQVFGKGQEEDISFVMNADLAAEHYALLLDEWKDKVSPLVVGRDSTKLKGWDDAALSNPIDIKSLLLSTAKALGEGNTKNATDLLKQVQQQGASPHGTGLQRTAHYFCEALMARINGMGGTIYTAIANTSQLPSALITLRVYKMVFEVCPYLKTAHYFANQCILKVLNGASRLHIVDYGVFYGFQWPSLIYALAHRPGGAPFIRITGIELPAKFGDVGPSTIEGTGRRLADYAKAYNVSFEYHQVSNSNWEGIDPSSLRVLPGEVLVLNSFNRLRHLHDESDGPGLSARNQLLQHMRNLNPHLLVTGFVNASHNSPFFVPRFREALHYYSNKFDTLHTVMNEDTLERGLFEREVMGRAILNVVACEGIQRVERPETYKQWQTRIEKAGFRPCSLLPSVWSTAKDIMKSYHKDFSLMQDSNIWLLLGWRGRIMQSLSAWKPSN